MSCQQIPSLSALFIYFLPLKVYYDLYSLASLQENLQQWLTDEKARDQFVIRAGSDTEVLWNDAMQLKAEPVYKRAVSRIYLSKSKYPDTIT